MRNGTEPAPRRGPHPGGHGAERLAYGRAELVDRTRGAPGPGAGHGVLRPLDLPAAGLTSAVAGAPYGSGTGESEQYLGYVAVLEGRRDDGRIDHLIEERGRYGPYGAVQHDPLKRLAGAQPCGRRVTGGAEHRPDRGAAGVLESGLAGTAGVLERQSAQRRAFEARGLEEFVDQ